MIDVEDQFFWCDQHCDTCKGKAIAFDSFSLWQKRCYMLYLLYAADSFDYQEPLQSLVVTTNSTFGLVVPEQSSLLADIRSIIAHRNDLDQLVKPAVYNWKFERIGCITKLIIRIALWEMYAKNIAPNIIINEAVELAKFFAERDAYRFVNGLLDHVMKANSHEKVSLVLAGG